jgi:hypothetical protein
MVGRGQCVAIPVSLHRQLTPYTERQVTLFVLARFKLLDSVPTRWPLVHNAC